MFLEAVPALTRMPPQFDPSIGDEVYDTLIFPCYLCFCDLACTCVYERCEHMCSGFFLSSLTKHKLCRTHSLDLVCRDCALVELT